VSAVFEVFAVPAVLAVACSLLTAGCDGKIRDALPLRAWTSRIA
jgi:hypothetical protein